MLLAVKCHINKVDIDNDFDILKVQWLFFFLWLFSKQVKIKQTKAFAPNSKYFEMNVEVSKRATVEINVNICFKQKRKEA